MGSKIRKEEYTALGDFLLPAFERDQTAIMVRYPKLNNTFLIAFKDKLDFVKGLESKIVLNERQKNATKSLYATSAALSKELTYLNSYIKDAGLDMSGVRLLKRELHNRNIEGAILHTAAVKQYVLEHLEVLTAEGMPLDTIEKLTNYKEEMETKNAAQNLFMNKMKELTDTNITHYEELYSYISNISEKGKLVFKDTVIQDEYNLSKNISRMRSSVQKSVRKSTPLATD